MNFRIVLLVFHLTDPEAIPYVIYTTLILLFTGLNTRNLLKMHSAKNGVTSSRGL